MLTNTMKPIAAALLMLAFSTTSWAGFVEGVAAYNRGDFAAALQEWRPLAEQGHAPAQFNLRIMYNKGEGVAKDDVEAVKWYRRAAEQENDSDVLVHLSFVDFLILLTIFVVLLVVVNMRKEEAQKRKKPGGNANLARKTSATSVH